MTGVVTARFTIHPGLGAQESLLLLHPQWPVPSLTRAATSASSAKLQPSGEGRHLVSRSVSPGEPRPGHATTHPPVLGMVLEGQP